MTLPATLHYTRDVSWTGVLMAELAHQGPSTVALTFNYDGRPEIGVYQKTISPEAFRRAADTFVGVDFQRLPRYGEFPPDTKFVALGARYGADRSPVLHSYPLDSVPPEVERLSSEFEPIFADIRRHPVRVLALRAQLPTDSVQPGVPLVFDAEIQNAGSAPLTCGNPLGVAAGEWSGLRINVRPVEGPAGASRNANVSASELRSQPDASSGAVAQLAPGETVRFTVRKKAFLAPGVYTVGLSYQAVVQTAALAFVDGEIRIDVGRLTVT
jgi:hypothetical protein